MRSSSGFTPHSRLLKPSGGSIARLAGWRTTKVAHRSGRRPATRLPVSGASGRKPSGRLSMPPVKRGCLTCLSEAANLGRPTGSYRDEAVDLIVWRARRPRHSVIESRSPASFSRSGKLKVAIDVPGRIRFATELPGEDTTLRVERSQHVLQVPRPAHRLRGEALATTSAKKRSDDGIHTTRREPGSERVASRRWKSPMSGTLAGIRVCSAPLRFRNCLTGCFHGSNDDRLPPPPLAPPSRRGRRLRGSPHLWHCLCAERGDGRVKSISQR